MGWLTSFGRDIKIGQKSTMLFMAEACGAAYAGPRCVEAHLPILSCHDFVRRVEVRDFR